MEIGTKVRMLEDFSGNFKKGQIVSCSRLFANGTHQFVNELGDVANIMRKRYELIEDFKIGEIYDFSDDDGIKYSRKLVALKNDVLDYVTCSNNFDLNKIDMRFSCSIYKNIHHIENPRIKEIESLISDLNRELQTIKNK